MVILLEYYYIIKKFINIKLIFYKKNYYSIHILYIFLISTKK